MRKIAEWGIADMSDELRLSMEKLVYGGDGLAHADGNTVFVPFVLPEKWCARRRDRKRRK
jgi:tRNA/tmRNA/rRNA uracil-C5-methylase (TrmA/RlmC/RlmD family)